MDDTANTEPHASRRLVHTRRSPVVRHTGPIAIAQAANPELQQLRITGVTGGWSDGRVYIGIGAQRACLTLNEAESLAAELRTAVRLARSFGTARGARP